jgi:tetratricopeptide (TPR) repeat protein
MNKFASLALAAGLLIPAYSAEAAVIVLGSDTARMCYEAAKKLGEPNGTVAKSSEAITGSRIELSPIEICSLAIEEGGLSARDLAGTYNNRGVLNFAQQNFAGALSDFDDGIRLHPDIGEAHVNRGATLIALQRWADSIPALDRGIAMAVTEPEKAYYNRAIAHEQLGNIREAYYDYLKASELRPEWQEPKTELTRFQVRRR